MLPAGKQSAAVTIKDLRWQRERWTKDGRDPHELPPHKNLGSTPTQAHSFVGVPWKLNSLTRGSTGRDRLLQLPYTIYTSRQSNQNMSLLRHCFNTAKKSFGGIPSVLTHLHIPQGITKVNTGGVSKEQPHARAINAR